MKQIIIIIFAIVTVSSAYSQTYLQYLQEGDSCFNNCDYTCAISKYNEAFKLATGKDKQFADIKLTKAKNCVEWTKTANQAFNNKNYGIAKENYQKIFDSNPNDTFAKARLEECNTALNPPKKPPLRKATTAELTDIWNNKYGIAPERRQNLINAGIDPDDAQTRINKGEGKPTTTMLTVSKEQLSFPSSGGSSEQIKVNSSTGTYSVSLIPSWCSVYKGTGYIVVTCNNNYNSTQSRSDWFKITAGNKEVKIYVNQAGTSSNLSATTLSVSKDRLSFSSSGGKSEQIKVYSNASTYSVSLMPSWCSVQTFNGYFVVTCNANYSSQSRSDSFKVTAGGKEVKISVNQSGKKKSRAPDVNKNAFGWDFALGYPLGHGIRYVHHFGNYFGVDFIKVNMVTDFEQLYLQYLAGIRFYFPAFPNSRISIYGACRFGYGHTLAGYRAPDGFCFETELGFNFTRTFFMAFSYSQQYDYRYVNSLKHPVFYPLSLRIGFNFGR